MVEVLHERCERESGDGCDALLVALADDAQVTFLERAIGQVEPAAFAHAQPASVEHFQDGPVAQRARIVADELFDERGGLLDGEHVGQLRRLGRQVHR